ncbi:MAG: FtsX-like permease family protein [Bdellovibrionales bacterium]|nr:FtsX-like permease family protein [Bdellovibrionales bacterium]
MLVGPTGTSRLTQIRAVDASFPFYGKIEASRYYPVEQLFPLKFDSQDDTKGVWVYPELLHQLKAKLGDSIRIGESEFTLLGVVTNDASAGISTSMAPRAYISINHLADTKLITPQSLVWYSTLFSIASIEENRLNEYEKTLKENSNIPQDVEIYSHHSSGQQMGRLINYLTDYLGLISLTALFLSAIGAIYLFRSYFSTKIYEIAVLQCLGMSPLHILILILVQMGLLGILGALPAIGASYLLVPGIATIVRKLLPIELDSSIEPITIIASLFIALTSSILICLPTAFKTKKIKPALLLRGEHRPSQPMHPLLVAATYSPALIGLWSLSIWQAHSWKVGSLFILLLGVSGSFIWLFGMQILKGISRWSDHYSFFFTSISKEMTRRPSSTLISFLSLSLGALLLNIAPQLQTNLQGELDHPEKSRLPSFFLFDIQEDQLSELEEFVSQLGLNLDQISPLVRARLLTVNGEDFERKKESSLVTREEERESRFRNRGFNLSYRSELSDSETITEGQDFTGPFDSNSNKLAEISVEKAFAERLDLRLGDKLLFDIQDIPIEGRIINFRKVKWTSFQPNFFIQFQSGVLESAPKTYLASLPDMEFSTRISVQDKIVDRFPNISLIDISRITKQLIDITQQMRWALDFMAFLNIFVGLFVLFAITNHQIRERRWEMTLLKVIGFSTKKIRNMFIIQFFFVSLMASLVGVVTSLAVSYSLSNLLFDSLWLWQWQAPLYSILFVVILSFLVCYFSSKKILNMKPNMLLSRGKL